MRLNTISEREIKVTFQCHFLHEICLCTFFKFNYLCSIKYIPPHILAPLRKWPVLQTT